MRRWSLILLAVAAAFATAPRVEAQTKSPPSAAERQKEIESAFEAGAAAGTRGPATVQLLAQGRIELPDGYIFIPKSEGARIMSAIGNRTGTAFVGLILSTASDAAWMTTLNFISSGFVKDDDAKNWNAAELLQSLKDGTEEGNADRVQRGFQPIEVSGWIEPPGYDGTTQRLIWSALVRRKEGATEANSSVNYNTYALGREGYFSLNLITGQRTVDSDKRHAHRLLGALAFNEGKRYADFNSSTDRVAEYGLAALIAGAAAKKLGLFALAFAFVAKFAKVIAIGAFGVIAVAGKLFSRRKKDDGEQT